jgi:hypothetical protein
MEVAVRFGVFIAVFLLMAAWEAWLPKRRLSLTRRRRWPVNIGLTVLSTLLMRISIGATAWQAALWAQAQHMGLFNRMPFPHWPAFALSLLLLIWPFTRNISPRIAGAGSGDCTRCITAILISM